MCRAYLSDWFDSNGEVQFEGRCNLGAQTLNFPMILQQSREENIDFFVLLEEYMQAIRKFNRKRVEYVGKARADSNPLCFMEGGILGGNLQAHEKIAPLIKNATISFGIGALHETQVLYNGKSLKEDSGFANEIMDFIVQKVDEFKKEDGIMYAIYNTPAESYCSTARSQFVKKYGVIKGVSDKEYFTNSNHLWVGEEISPVEKQDKEIELFKKSMGGHICYLRISNPDNLEGLKALILRGVKMGFYQGVNFPSCVCNHCGNKGHEFGGICPKCGSDDLNVIDRICGYLGFTVRAGESTMNEGKLCEIKDRVSM